MTKGGSKLITGGFFLWAILGTEPKEIVTWSILQTFGLFLSETQSPSMISSTGMC
jgi:hypothetical protein